MQTDWEIKARSGHCSRTGRQFTDGELFYTLLYRDESGFRREDVSQEAWHQRNDNIQPFSFWRMKFEAPPPAPPDPLEKKDAESLLRRLISENNARYENAIFVLALMLERKKILRAVESQDSDVLVYEHHATGETLIIKNPGLSIERIPEVQREVTALLSESFA